MAPIGDAARANAASSGNFRTNSFGTNVIKRGTNEGGKALKGLELAMANGDFVWPTITTTNSDLPEGSSREFSLLDA